MDEQEEIDSNINLEQDGIILPDVENEEVQDDNIEQIVTNLLADSQKLDEMSKNAKSISKPNATNDICKILLQTT